METYEAACQVVGDESPAALELYAWNAKVSGALMPPLHVCEVTVRNAVADVLEAIYGPLWPWSATFERSLPAGPMATALRQARDGCSSAGKVIPELSFHFWQRMFTSRYDVRLWQPHLLRVFPNLDAGKPVCQLRQAIYGDLEQVRKLRNRISHHEPIFMRDLTEDFQRIVGLVRMKCVVTTGWMLGHQHALALIQSRP
ncbi:hypothetical protein [Cupriavidus pauculus]|nr:hypothetical protein [Cupriavidus pauculus]